MYLHACSVDVPEQLPSIISQPSGHTPPTTLKSLQVFITLSQLPVVISPEISQGFVLPVTLFSVSFSTHLASPPVSNVSRLVVNVLVCSHSWE